MLKVKNLIVGCGLSGAVLGERIASQLGEDVFIIDKRAHIGGNVYDYKDHNGITIHQYGPHVFHTKEKHVFDYLSQFTEWHLFMYRVKAVIDGKEVSIPFNLNTIYALFPPEMAARLENKLIAAFGFDVSIPVLELKKTQDKELAFLASYIYDKAFLGYTVKQWGLKPEELDVSVTSRVPISISRDERYFKDKYQALPAQGYTRMVERILDHPLIQVQLETDFETCKNQIQYERLFYTGPIDAFFAYQYGPLPYRSLQLKFVEYDQPYFQSGPQINYSENYDFTRIVEYKYYLDEHSDKTVVSYEYPEAFVEGKNDRYYPVPNADSAAIYGRYLAEAAKLDNVYFFGRLGDYKYYNMDQTVARALALYEKIKPAANS